MSNAKSLQFWVEQEPVEKDETVLFLPPDTPTNNPAPHILNQIKKKKTLRHKRALYRLENCYFESLKKLRTDFKKTVESDKLPTTFSQEYTEIVPGQEFFITKSEGFTDLLGYIDDYIKNPKPVSPQSKPKNTKESSSTATLEFEERVKRTEYKLAVETLFEFKQKEIERQYFDVLDKLKRSKNTYNDI
ncbi:hypothetical protein BY458DRAFT_481212 [Sporodiniella umbellata]|nr:hypothetical protein BY458DRAFT_481212 [Sporodiniella umbellata]